MSQDTQHDHISKKRVVYTMPGVNAVRVRRDEAYRVTDAGALTMDLYYPPDSKSGARTPAVIFVTGFHDTGAQRMLGCRLKEMGSYISWGQLAAASGLVAITYTNSEPATDVGAVLQHVRQNAASLEIDGNRIGMWAGSGNVPTALSLLMQGAQDYLTCAVLCYGYMLDLDGSTAVADAARRWGFVNPCAGKSVDDLPRDMPLFIARAGQDQMPGLNETLDRFLVKALARNLPITFVNHSAAPHAFDLFHDSEPTREIIRRMLAFLQWHLVTEARFHLTS
jgi:acetyl esterase/lipase